LQSIFSLTSVSITWGNSFISFWTTLFKNSPSLKNQQIMQSFLIKLKNRVKLKMFQAFFANSMTFSNLIKLQLLTRKLTNDKKLAIIINWSFKQHLRMCFCGFFVFPLYSSKVLNLHIFQVYAKHNKESMLLRTNRNILICCSFESFRKKSW
jgi:hypothetical protein